MYSKFHYHLSLLSNLYSVILFTFSLQQASIINFYDQQHAPGYLQRCSCSKTLVGSKRMSSIISKESKKLKESRKSIWLLETIVEHTTSRTSSIFLFSPFTWQSTYQFYISMLLVYSFYLSYSSNRILDERRKEKKKSEERGRRRDLISEQQSPLCLASPRLYLAGALFARYSAASRSSKHANRFQG